MHIWLLNTLCFQWKYPVHNQCQILHDDQRLSSSTHISKKCEKFTNVLWMCRGADEARWGLGHQQMLWVLRAIVHSLFLLGIVVWWKSILLNNHLAQIAKVNRTAFVMTTGAFKLPTLVLEFFLNVTPLDITAQRYNTYILATSFTALTSKMFVFSLRNCSLPSLCKTDKIASH